jgi:hypothetical protein
MQLRNVDPVERQKDALVRLWGGKAPHIAQRYLNDATRLRRPAQIQFWQDVLSSLAPDASALRTDIAEEEVEPGIAELAAAPTVKRAKRKSSKS